ncbi:MAG: 5-carboxymethyl-2-hydroxymuconate Delta-isomerase [Hyphomicrobiales bacterium]
MPHFVVEYSANLEKDIDVGALCEALRVAGLETGIFPEAGIRVRARKCDVYAIADGKLDAGFIDISARLRGGRALDIRKKATAQIFSAAEAFLEPLFTKRPFALSFEMRDIDPELSPKRSSISDFMNVDSKNA